MENEENVTLSKEEHEKLLKDLEEAKTATGNVVEELKTMRSEKAAEEEAKKALEEKIAELEKAGTPEDVELTPEKVRQMASEQASEILRQAEEDRKKVAKDSVEQRFKETHNEFHPDNDPGGIKYAAFQRELSRFNLGAMQVEEVQKAYEDAYRLMEGNNTRPESANPDNPSEPVQPSTPPTADPNTLTIQEKNIVQETFGGDTERYLKLKAKDPDFVEDLLQHAK